YYNYLNFPVTPWRGYGEQRTFDIQQVYESNPADKTMNENNPLLLGMTCALWTDYGVTEQMIDQRLFPRILALSEQMWSRGNREPFNDFYQRVKKSQPWLESLGFRFGSALRDE
ncbi:MAG: family 20 glycosylhydrolase, partial [Roseburia sp.]|nr:family 20 glycosylhydrolase [Roseburia sp.]